MVDPHQIAAEAYALIGSISAEFFELAGYQAEQPWRLDPAPPSPWSDIHCMIAGIGDVCISHRDWLFLVESWAFVEPASPSALGETIAQGFDIIRQATPLLAYVGSAHGFPNPPSWPDVEATLHDARTDLSEFVRLVGLYSFVMGRQRAAERLAGAGPDG